MDRPTFGVAYARASPFFILEQKIAPSFGEAFHFKVFEVSSSTLAEMMTWALLFRRIPSGPSHGVAGRISGFLRNAYRIGQDL